MAVVDKALAYERENRYQTADEMRNALRVANAAIEGLAGVARRLAVALAVAGAVIVGLLVSAYLLLRAWVLSTLAGLAADDTGFVDDAHLAMRDLAERIALDEPHDD